MKSVYLASPFFSDKQKERIYQVKEALVKNKTIDSEKFSSRTNMNIVKQNSAVSNGKKQPSSSMFHKFLRPTSLLRSSTIKWKKQRKTN